MAQKIKFVFEDGRFRIQSPSIDLTKKVITEIQYDSKAMYHILVDGEYAPEVVKRQPVQAKVFKKHNHYHGGQ